MISSVQFERLGDSALLLRLGDAIDAALSARVLALAARVQAARPSWLIDCVPAYASLALFVEAESFSAERDPLAEAEAWLREMLTGTTQPSGAMAAERLVEIPVSYGGENGPDLEPAARELQITCEELILRHTSPSYTVAMLGFAPGFPYLLGLDPSLALPRLATPRRSVPAGSVGIGGAQTGIYPRVSPGGWRLLGRTPLELFDAGRVSPSLLAPGDHVRFVAIDADAAHSPGDRG